MNTMMMCGHAAQGTNSGGNPVCVICIGTTPDARIVDPNPPDLSGRVAKCSYCTTKRPSEPRLAFFTHLPAREYDDFYCGCRGWD